MVNFVYCLQHEAGRKAYDAALEKIQETKLKVKEKEADLVRLTTELASSQTSLESAKEEEQVSTSRDLGIGMVDKYFFILLEG